MVGDLIMLTDQNCIIIPIMIIETNVSCNRQNITGLLT